jgi:hypothetical protein
VSIRILFLVGALICFLGVVAFGGHMTGPEEVHRFLAGGLAFLAAAGLPVDRLIP